MTEELIGHGGMGTVYRARQLSLGQPVAIKLLSEPLRARSGFVARFESEARLQANLQHPHILPVLDGGSVEGVPYLVMRLVDEFSLRELIRVRGLAPAQLVELLGDVAGALDHAHSRGVLHLDVKPHNVLVEDGRHAWLADFGLTRMLEGCGEQWPSVLLGSLDYLAPELARGEPPGVACDVYSLAVTAFQSLTGRLPFPLARDAQAVHEHSRAARPRASALVRGLPAAVDVVLQRGMAIDPGARQPTAGALAGELCDALGRYGSEHCRLRPAEGGAGQDVASEVPSSLPTLVPVGAGAADG